MTSQRLTAALPHRIHADRVTTGRLWTRVKNLSTNPNPTLFRTREASKPYSGGQWDAALKATPHSPTGDVSYVMALEQSVRSGAHGFRSCRPRSRLTLLNFCRIRLSSRCAQTGDM